MGDQPGGAAFVVELVERAANGDREAWERLLERYSGRLWVVIRSYPLSHHDAQDVAQTVLCALTQHLSRLRDPSSIGAWLATTAHNECRLQLKRLRRTAPHDPGLFDEPDHRSPESLHIAAEGAHGVRAAIARLDLPDRLVALLAVTEPDLPAEEVSRVTGVPLDRLRTVRRRTRRRLQRLLREDG
ncbi:RNA polymerase sigma factor [Marinactinospora thermotolerans]|uniref:RNA polymerase sigma factor, sigma-70 family n=1 Tax=Marinactinospora thermotolerans DSM 45154 TaxID=1122192 RepID=A0A1T4SMZ6_9ACTN|nr:sigma-70 family RNA polymerase sigma factor [Marinactinospora thermotolerans]SKA29278.1 RNA polymerase sigma factor, sigma-70 family [Marinactinospora thermotolerans DSM 45154]